MYETVQKIANRLNIKTPEVWIYDSPDPNAFATGPSKNNSMVAVSTGLLNNLNEGEVRAVLAHEMGHVYNGDMFTTTILAGLMNTFVYFISRIVYRQVAERNPMLGLGVYFFLQIVLSILAMIPISWWSRRREFSADKFAANTVGTGAHDLGAPGDRSMGQACRIPVSDGRRTGDHENFRTNAKFHANLLDASADRRPRRRLTEAVAVSTAALIVLTRNTKKAH